MEKEMFSESVDESLSTDQESHFAYYKKTISLFPHQKENFFHSVDLFSAGHKFKIDCSPTGSGKTYVSLAVAQLFGLRILVVAPKPLQAKWKSVANEHGIDSKVLTYNALRGQSDGLLNHGLIRRVNKKYQATDLLRQYLDEGCLVIFDEVQNGKNKTLTNSAMRCLAHEVQISERGIMIFVSATIFDREKMGTNVLGFLGFDEEGAIITHNNVVPKRSEISPEILKWLKEQNPVYMSRIASRIQAARKGDLDEILYQCYLKVVKPKFAFAMTEFQTEFNVDFYNGYFNFSKADEKQLIAIYNDLLKSFTQSREDGERLDMQKFSKSLTQIELIKTHVISRLTQHILEHTNYSIVIGLHYLQSIIHLAETFADYNPAILTGDSKLTNQKKRNEIIDDFQEGKTRIIICTLQVGGVGIDLHDKVGNRPRVVMASADHRAIDLTQVLGRVRRVGMKSPAFGLLIYCNALDETSIWRSLLSKGQVIKDSSTFTAKNDNQQIKYFNEFKRFDEGKGNPIPAMDQRPANKIENRPTPISDLFDV